MIRDDLEKTLAAEIRLLQNILKLERRKGAALGSDDMDLVEELNSETVDAIEKLTELEKEARRLADEFNRTPGAGPSSRLRQLDEAVGRLAQEAKDLTEKTQGSLMEEMRDILQRINRLRAGRVALAGYKEGIGQAPVKPSRGET